MTSSEHHVVLGGTGVVGHETLAALIAMDRSVVSVSRSGKGPSGTTAIAADLRDASSAVTALKGFQVAYLTVGLPYSLKIWRTDWPLILRNTIDACLTHGTHLVYFDNVYAYGRVDQPMTETTQIRPSSKKGQLRSALLDMLDIAVRERGLAVTMGRSADFYGPGASTSVFNAFVVDRVKAGKAPSWLINSGLPHSMTYTPDIGHALAILGTDSRARGQVWHLPTAPALTGDDYMTLAGSPRSAHRVMSLTTLRMGALFTGAAREALEMSYQNSEPYFFDSSLFQSTFTTEPTPYDRGIEASLKLA